MLHYMGNGDVLFTPFIGLTGILSYSSYSKAGSLKGAHPLGQFHCVEKGLRRDVLGTLTK